MHYESFQPGLSTVTARRAVTAEELDAFLDLAGLHLPMFLDDEGAREVGHPRRLVMVLSMKGTYLFRRTPSAGASATQGES